MTDHNPKQHFSQAPFVVTEIEGVLVVDSRLIAARLGIEHESFLRTIKKYQTKIEQHFGQFRFEIGTVANSVGAVNQTKYALLTEAQATVLMTLSRNTYEVVECKIELVGAFEKAKQLLQNKQTSNPYWYRRLKIFRAKTKIPLGYWCIFEEIITMVADLEHYGYILKDGLIPDISVGKCWAFYLKSEGIKVETIVLNYPHYYPGRKEPVFAYIYPNAFLPQFKLWFEQTYKPIKMLNYFKKTDPLAMPSVCRLLGLPEAK